MLGQKFRLKLHSCTWKHQFGAFLTTFHIIAVQLTVTGDIAAQLPASK